MSTREKERIVPGCVQGVGATGTWGKHRKVSDVLPFPALFKRTQATFLTGKCVFQVNRYGVAFVARTQEQTQSHRR